MIPTHRILTRKTKLKFGRWKSYTVQDLLNLGRKLDLISAYYNLTAVNYTEDILNELKISKEYRIIKPSANKEQYYKFLNENGYKMEAKELKTDNIMKGGTKLETA